MDVMRNRGVVSFKLALRVSVRYDREHHHRLVFAPQISSNPITIQALPASGTSIAAREQPVKPTDP